MTDEQIRAQAVQAASRAWSMGGFQSVEQIIHAARAFEKYIRNGK